MRTYRLHDTSWSRIVSLRAQQPEAIVERLATRRRVDTPTTSDGRLVLLSCNQRVDPRSGAYVDRRQLLDRIVEALSIPQVDGVVASADLLEELTLLNVLERKLAFCSATGATRVGVGVSGATIVANNFDGAMISQRWEPTGFPHEASPACATSDVADFASLGLPTLFDLRIAHPPTESELDSAWSDWVEPLHATTAALATGAGVWISVPTVRGLPYLAEASGFPMLVRDTDVPISPAAWSGFFASELPETIRGTIAGSSALFPIEGTVAEATQTIANSVRSTQATQAA